MREGNVPLISHDHFRANLAEVEMEKSEHVNARICVLVIANIASSKV